MQCKADNQIFKMLKLTLSGRLVRKFSAFIFIFSVPSNDTTQHTTF